MIFDIKIFVGIAIFIVSLIGLIGFLITKKEGFGRFNTSTLLLLMVITISSLLFISDFLDDNTMENLIFAIIGFAGGLFTGRDENASTKKNSEDSKNYIVKISEQK